MRLRNFWFKAQVDGKGVPVTGGPKAEGGGMTIDLYVNKEGTVHEALHITCEPMIGSPEMLVLSVKVSGEVVHQAVYFKG